MKNAAIILAAGLSKRFGNKTPKQFFNLNGRPVFLWSVVAFSSIKNFNQIIIVVPSNRIKFLTLRYKINSEYVVGGNKRFDSVRNGLSLVKDDIDFVAIHDAARPLISRKDIMSVLKEAEITGAAIAVEKTSDTIKLISKDGKIIKTFNRYILRNAQTPQIFELKLLKKAYSIKIPNYITDDSQLVESLKIRVSTVETKSPNFKITTKQDFEIAKRLLVIKK
jgi:2-C-methyl-D-erythritol 4-phosphate cytidylyltransferase